MARDLCDGRETVDHSAKESAFVQEVLDLVARRNLSLVRISKYAQCIEAFGLAPRSVFHTARTEVEDRIIGLSSGGDDCVTKPFRVQEFCCA